MEKGRVWTDICANARIKISRSLIHMKTGLFSASREDILHTAILERLPLDFVQHHVNGSALVFNNSGIKLKINPHHINSISETSQCTALLRHAEHLFLSHPSRKRTFQRICLQEAVPFHEELFQFCADIEANSSIGGYAESNTVHLHHVHFTEIPRAMSAEAMYRRLLHLWEQDSLPFTQLLEKHNCCSSREWCTQISEDTCGHIFSTSNITDFVWKMIERDVDRILIMAREGLSSVELDALPKPTRKGIADVFSRHNIEPTDPGIIEDAKTEVERIIIKMLRQDPFFGEFLNQCILEITDSLPTAGVVMMRKHVLLAVNPTFFINSLKNTEERGAVLKHEALHIILKHLIQMRNPMFTDKFLYNIAADLEVNQYIGPPWSLPEGAIVLGSFPKLNLPKSEIAEVYYALLQTASTNPNQSQTLEQMRKTLDHAGNGHSDHRGWSGDQSAGSSLPRGNKQSLMNGIGNADIGDLPIHEQSIEEMVQQAVSASNRAGKTPGKILDLLAEWINARKPSIDWKRMLRIFATSGGQYKRMSTHRKKNARYFQWRRRMLEQYQVTADILFYFAQHDAKRLPTKNWGDLNPLSTEALRVKTPMLAINGNESITWSDIGIRELHVVRTQHPDWDWPQWDDVPEKWLLRFNIIRTPLDLNTLPTNIFVLLAKEYPEVLPEISWGDFGNARNTFIKNDYPSLFRMEVITWGMLPSQLISWIVQNTQLLGSVSWNDVPPQLLVNNPYFQFDGHQAFSVERKISKSLPGTKKQKVYPKLLCILDTSGSVSQTDVETLFSEVHQLYKMGVEVYVLEADTKPQLFWKYTGQRPYGGGGGTDFDPALEWVNQAKNGANINIFKDNAIVEQEIKIQFDGVVYLTDGQANPPSVEPYCKTLWLITPETAGGTKSFVQEAKFKTLVVSLPPYDKR